MIVLEELVRIVLEENLARVVVGGLGNRTMFVLTRILPARVR